MQTPATASTLKRTQLTGWLLPGRVSSDSQQRWVRRATSWHGRATSRDTPAPDGDAGAGLLAEQVENQDGLLCAVVGSIRWRTDDFARLARAQGHARALAQAYREHGQELVCHLGGHYACAVLDPGQRLAFLIVDRMSTVPLQFAILSGGGLLFSTSADILRHHGEVDSQLSAQALHDYAYFHMVPSPGAIYRGVRRLEPGHLATISGGRVAVRRHWQPTFCNSRAAPQRALADELHSSVRAAVASCEPDSQTGAFLSGGLDSSTVAGVLAQLLPHPARTYSMGFNVAQFDEMSYVRTVAQHFHLDSRELYVQPGDVADVFATIAAHCDQPFGNSSAVPTLLCARFAAANGTRQLLAGDGGDELFGGNQRYADQKVFEWYWRMPASIRGVLVDRMAAWGASKDSLWPLRKLNSYVAQARIPMPERIERYNFLSRTPRQEVFERDFLNLIDAQHPEELLRTSYREAPTQATVDRMLYLDWKFTLADNDLRKVSAMCDLAGVEVRYPLLDDAVIDLSLKLPPHWKVRGVTLRHFYKRAMRGFLPDRVLHKRKHGFGLPYGEWLKTDPRLQQISADALHDLRSRGVFRPEFLDRLIAEHRSGHAGFYGTFIWVLAMLELWLQSHDQPRGALALAA